MTARTGDRSVAVIGAGMAGLTCARQLTDAGHSVSVFEKSRDIGGRLATRRIDSLRWNHGASQVQVTSKAFGKMLELLGAAGTAAQEITTDGQTVYSGVPDMREMLRPLAAGLSVSWEIQINSLRRRGQRWYLLDAAAAEYGPFDIVLVTIPAPQARMLFERSSIDDFSILDSVTMDPCWVTLLAFNEPVTLPASLNNENPIHSYHPGGTDPTQHAQRLDRTWVLLATTHWSQQHLESDRASVAATLLDCFRQSSSVDLTRLQSAVGHRWRYATTDTALGSTHIWSESRGIGLAGDWCLGVTAQCAFESGQALAESCHSSLVA